MRWMLGIVCWAAAAEAHVGAAVAKANFTHPAPIDLLSDGGTHYHFVPEAADQSFRIEWDDGDVDPTGRFTFYYLDHAISDGLTAKQLPQEATLVRDLSGRDAERVYVSCSCDGDAGVKCPGGDGGPRWCDNFVQWDTHALPDGSYWIAALNDDDPYLVYNLSPAPVRIHHTVALPPAVLLLTPDGVGTADLQYHLQLLAVGTGAMKMDLSYGNDDYGETLGPLHAIAQAVPAVVGSDGTVGYDWALSSVKNGTYFVRVQLSDSVGQAFADSRYGLVVFHGSGSVDAAVSDAGDGGGIKTLMPPRSGCSCQLAAQRRPTGWWVLWGILGGLGVGRVISRRA